ncbi:MAG: hypothetical protein AAF098_07075 [Pseudomonadota bacterium]
MMKRQHAAVALDDAMEILSAVELKFHLERGAPAARDMKKNELAFVTDWQTNVLLKLSFTVLDPGSAMRFHRY